MGMEEKWDESGDSGDEDDKTDDENEAFLTNRVDGTPFNHTPDDMFDEEEGKGGDDDGRRPDRGSLAGPVRKGNMKKKLNRLNSKFAARFFVLDDGVLYYYRKESNYERTLRSSTSDALCFISVVFITT